jgi:hypothetical protein
MATTRKLRAGGTRRAPARILERVASKAGKNVGFRFAWRVLSSAPTRADPLIKEKNISALLDLSVDLARAFCIGGHSMEDQKTNSLVTHVKQLSQRYKPGTTTA